MNKIFTHNIKWIFGGLLTTLLALIVTAQTNISLAHPPRQEGDQPNFTVTTQTAADGSATIVSQEARLDSNYFTAYGDADGVETDSSGLVLAAKQTEGTYVSGVIYSPLAFTTDVVPLWDVDLPEGSELTLETRLSLDNGQSWSNWIENPEAFYPVRNNEHSGSLIWVGSDQAALQLRVTLRSSATGISPTLRSLTLAFSDTSNGPTDGEIAGKMAQQVSSAGDSALTCPVKPSIVSRTDWGCPDGQNSPRRSPTYQPVTHVIIHQTETPNNTDPYQDWAGWVRSVWNYHANVLWWGDVGYNYLIDPTGVIYEGRAGGDDVIGIHDGINAGSMAIGFLGCYGACDNPWLSVDQPSEAMLESAAELIAWKLSEAELDPHGSGAYGHLSDVPVIAGGRDVAWTSSPGDNLYAQLPNLRDKVSEQIAQCDNPLNCRVDDIIFDQAEYTVGDPIHLTAKLVDQDDKPLGGAKVSFDVTISETAASMVNASAFDLIDRTGDYDGVYTDTTQVGTYLFTVSATDPNDNQFSCSAEKSVIVKPVVDPPDCKIEDNDVIFDKERYTISDTINITAAVTDQSNNPLTGADVTAIVNRPDNAIEQFGFAGTGPYTGNYSNTSVEGNYTFQISASDPTNSIFSTCSITKTVPVDPVSQDPICTITTQADPNTVETGNPVNLMATVSVSGTAVTDANVTAQITKPDSSSVSVTLPPDGTGGYEQAFTDTTVDGTYNFTATATGQGFQQCQASNSFLVEQQSITETTIIIEPTTGQLCANSDDTLTTKIRIAQVANLQGFSFKLNYDPSIVSVVDADPGTTDVTEIRVGDDFDDNVLVIAANKVNNGVIEFAIALDDAFNGDAVLAEIDWQPVAVGSSPLTFSEMKLSNPDGISISRQLRDGTIDVVSCEGSIVSGQIQLQGRESHDGVIVTNGQTNQTQTNVDGFFSIAGNNLLSMKAPGYLSAQANVQAKLGQVSYTGSLNLGTITLLAGDTNGDDMIDILDLAYLGARYGSTDLSADLNADGVVDILDLAMAAANYGQQGPLTNWD